MEAVSETEMVVGDAWPLPAVLMCPASEGRFPAAVIVGGSGAVDRDATVGPNKPFRDLALGLATLGICTLRYDKRLAAHRERAMAQVEQWTLRHNTIDDALQAIELLRARGEVDPGAVFAIGHSLGGYAMPRIAARAPELCGFVSMAGTPRHLREVFVPQARRFAAADGKVTAEERAAIAEIEAAVERSRRLHPGSRVDRKLLPGRLPAAFWLDLADHPLAPLIQAETRPWLFLQGERDINVGMEDFAAWKQLASDNREATFKSYPTLNHLFMTTSGSQGAKEHGAPGHVAWTVLVDIAAWIHAHHARRCRSR